MKSMLMFVRTTLAGGILFLVPFVVLVVVIGKALELVHKLVAPLAAMIPVDSVLGVRMERLLAIGAMVLACFLAGCLARTRSARAVVAWLEANILSMVPGYEFFKGVGESMFGGERPGSWQPVLVRTEDSYRLGFLTERLGNGWAAVFLPESPNPHVGEVHFVASDRVVPIDITPAAALKCVKRMGTGSAALAAELEKIQGDAGEKPDGLSSAKECGSRTGRGSDERGSL